MQTQEVVKRAEEISLRICDFKYLSRPLSICDPSTKEHQL